MDCNLQNLEFNNIFKSLIFQIYCKYFRLLLYVTTIISCFDSQNSLRKMPKHSLVFFFGDIKSRSNFSYQFTWKAFSVDQIDQKWQQPCCFSSYLPRFFIACLHKKALKFDSRLHKPLCLRFLWFHTGLIVLKIHCRIICLFASLAPSNLLCWFLLKNRYKIKVSNIFQKSYLYNLVKEMGVQVYSKNSLSTNASKEVWKKKLKKVLCMALGL